MIETNQRIINELHKVISQIQAYADASSGYYANSNAALQVLRAANQSVTSCLAGDGYGNLNWTTTAAARYKDWKVADKLGISKTDFIKMQYAQYGFKKRVNTPEIMWEVYVRLYEKYPEKDQSFIDWAWLKLMGSMVYDNMAWNLTAGSIVGNVPNPHPTHESNRHQIATEKSYFTKFLGLSDDDYETLRKTIDDQHKNDEGESYADFAHQCITAATEYRVRRGEPSSVDLMFSGGASECAQYAGWMGDCVLISENNRYVSLRIDDYKSDLDANNITTAAFKYSTSYQAAAHQYYTDLDNYVYTRADKFLENNGGYDNVVDQLYQNLVSDNDVAANIKGRVRVYGPSIAKATGIPNPYEPPTITTTYVDHTTSEKVEIMKRCEEELADTFCFLDALKSGKNELPEA